MNPELICHVLAKQIIQYKGKIEKQHYLCLSLSLLFIYWVIGMSQINWKRHFTFVLKWLCMPTEQLRISAGVRLFTVASCLQRVKWAGLFTPSLRPWYQVTQDSSLWGWNQLLLCDGANSLRWYLKFEWWICVPLTVLWELNLYTNVKFCVLWFQASCLVDNFRYGPKKGSRKRVETNQVSSLCRVAMILFVKGGGGDEKWKLLSYYWGFDLLHKKAIEN